MTPRRHRLWAMPRRDWPSAPSPFIMPCSWEQAARAWRANEAAADHGECMQHAELGRAWQSIASHCKQALPTPRACMAPFSYRSFRVTRQASGKLRCQLIFRRGLCCCCFPCRRCCSGWSCSWCPGHARRDDLMIERACWHALPPSLHDIPVGAVGPLPASGGGWVMQGRLSPGGAACLAGLGTQLPMSSRGRAVQGRRALGLAHCT